MGNISDLEANTGQIPSSMGTDTPDAVVVSLPPLGMVKVTNIYLDPAAGKLLVDVGSEMFEIAPASTVIQSNPASGKHQIYNILRNEDGNLEYEWEDNPTP